MAAMLSEDEFQRMLQSMQHREVKSQMKAKAVLFSELSSASNNQACTMESTTPRAKDQVIPNLFGQVLSIANSTLLLSPKLFLMCTDIKKLNFVCTMVKDGEFTALISIKDSLPDGPLLGTSGTCSKKWTIW
jgi:hypothetical protein